MSEFKRKPTPSQVEGPFYPSELKHAARSSLVGDELPPTSDRIQLVGQLLDNSGQPLLGGRVEIWQADSRGCYHHPNDVSNPDDLMPGFFYWGYAITDNMGRYSFDTVKPGAYNDDGEWRTPHIHFKIYLPDSNSHALLTQAYFPGEKLNSIDSHFQGLSGDERKRVLLRPSNKSESVAVYDFTLVLR